MIVRRLRDDEWPALRELRLAALADAPQAFGGTLAEAQALPDAQWQDRARLGARSDEALMVAESEGQMVGMALGALQDAARAQLLAMWVAPAARGSGAARQLVEAVIAWVREAGAQQIMLNVLEGNAAATGLYRACGFEAGALEPWPGRAGAQIRRMHRRLDD